MARPDEIGPECTGRWVAFSMATPLPQRYLLLAMTFVALFRSSKINDSLLQIFERGALIQGRGGYSAPA
jgi:hypothetical protein